MWNTKSKQLENKLAIVCKVQRKDGAGRGKGEYFVNGHFSHLWRRTNGENVHRTLTLEARDKRVQANLIVRDPS